MKNKTKILIITIAVIAGLVGYWLYEDHIGASGRLYPSKSRMCEQFAKSYLRTMRERENIDSLGGDAWQRAIAIESEINTLCQLDLTDEALEGYTPRNINRYLEVYRHQKGGEKE